MNDHHSFFSGTADIGFISFEGGDGCGKSTQQQRLARRLESQGHEVVLCRDPGSTPLGDEIRRILLHGNDLHITDRTEMFLFMAARAQLVDEVIRPALESGKIVLSDRFLLSSFVYQGYSGGVPVADLENVGRIAVDGILPKLIFVLDIPYETALERIGRRAVPDRMEAKGEEYHRRVRAGFLELARADPDHCVVLDGTLPAEALEAEIMKNVQEHFGRST